MHKAVSRMTARDGGNANNAGAIIGEMRAQRFLTQVPIISVCRGPVAHGFFPRLRANPGFNYIKLAVGRYNSLRTQRIKIAYPPQSLQQSPAGARIGPDNMV
jgi:hypothetical protein